MLNDKQRHVAYNCPGNTIVSASPGSGKTRTLVARAQHKLETLPAHKALALITFTNAGADEIAERLVIKEHNVFIGTIHRFCLEFILRPFGWLYDWERPRIITNDELLEFVELNQKTITFGNSPLDEINLIKRNVNGELDLDVDWSNARALEYVAELYFAFLQSKKAIDFNEILYRSYKIVSENPFVVNSLANKFYEISIDEFQDTNIFQYEIFRIINTKNVSTFFMVGDEKQRIYRFAGAMDNAFTQASGEFNTPIEILEVTYRSTQNIINAYSALFGNHPNLQNESEYKDEDIPISVVETQNANHNDTVQRTIEFLLNANVPLHEIAILSTRWQDALLISRALRNRYRVVGLGALPHRHVNNSTFSLLRSVCRFMYSNTVRNIRIIKRNIELHDLENGFGLSEVQINGLCNNLIFKFSGIDKNLVLEDGMLIFKEIFDDAFKISHETFLEILQMVDEEEKPHWTTERYMETLSGVAGITVNTIHQAKGLEYDAVILNSINENRLPYQQLIDRSTWTYSPLTPESIEDGRTLLYVGISRAKVFLSILHNWRPSMFIPIVRRTLN